MRRLLGQAIQAQLKTKRRPANTESHAAPWRPNWQRVHLQIGFCVGRRTPRVTRRKLHNSLLRQTAIAGLDLRADLVKTTGILRLQ